MKPDDGKSRVNIKGLLKVVKSPIFKVGLQAKRARRA